MRPGSFGAALSSFAYLNYRKSSRYFLIGTPVLVAFCLLIRLADESDASFASSLAPLFFFTWAWYAMKVLSGASLSDPRLPIDTPLPSTYPRNYSTLPLPASTLVLAPVLSGISAPILVWLLYCAIVAIPLKLGVYPFLPPSGLALPPLVVLAFVTSFGTMRWTSGGKPMFGCLMPFVAIVFMVVLFLSIFGSMTTRIPIAVVNVPIPGLEACCLAMTCASLWISLSSAAAARSGIPILPNADQPPKNSWLNRRLTAEGAEKRIRTPIQAISWMLDRNMGRLGCVVVGAVVVAVVLLRIPFSANEIDTPLGVGHILVGSATLQTFFILLAGAVLSSASGQVTNMVIMMPVAKDKDLILRQWYSVRPIPSLQLATCLAIQSARWVLRNGAVIGIGMAIWLALPAREGGRSGPILSLLLQDATPRGVLLVLTSAAAIFTTVWATTLGSPLGYPWKTKSLRSFAPIGGVILIVPMMTWLIVPTLEHLTFRGAASVQERMSDTLLKLGLALTPVLGVWMAVRLVLLLIGIRKARKTDLIPTRTVMAATGTWLAAALLFGATFSALLPSAIPTGLYFLYASILLPLNRLIWPVLTIDAARHN